MADWFAVYQESDGRLISVGTVVADPLPAGLGKKLIGPTRDATLIWNESTLVFDPAVPKLPDVDRVDEVLAAMTKNGGRYTEAEVRREVALLLGPFRFRGADEERDLR